MFLVFAIYNPVNFAKVDKAIAEELDKFFKEGVQAKELGAGVKGLLQARKGGRSTDAALAGQLAAGLASGRTFAFVAELEKKMAELTPEAVQSAFRRHIDPKR